MDYSTLQIFSCLPYSLIDSQKTNKLESKSKKCIFIGFNKGVKSFRLWDPKTKSSFTSRDVIFDKESMLQEKSETEDIAQGGASESSPDTQENEVEFSESPKRPEGLEKDSSDSDRDEQEATQEQLRPLRRSVRVTMPPTRYDWEDNYVSFAIVTKTGNPSSYREVIETDERQVDYGLEAGDGVFR